MDYLGNFKSGEAYALKTSNGRVHSARNSNSRTSVEAFIGAADKASRELGGCTIDDTVDETSATATVTLSKDGATALLKIDYGRSHGYDAKVILQNQELKVQGGAKVALKKIVKHLDPRTTAKRAKAEAGKPNYTA